MEKLIKFRNIINDLQNNEEKLDDEMWFFFC